MINQRNPKPDEVLIDLTTKEAKISMNNSEEKVKISYLN